MATSRFSAIELSQLPSPQLIEALSAEKILSDSKAWVTATWDVLRASRPDLPPLDTLALETEPITIILEALAYRETLLRARVNDAAKALMIAFSTGTDLDNMAADMSVVRMTTPVLNADGTPQYGTDGEALVTEESDERLRRRRLLAVEALSTCGPAGAYVYFALSVSLDVDDAYAYSPDEATGKVNVVLAGVDGADVSDATLAAVIERINREETVPLTDIPVVRRAEVVPYSVNVDLKMPRGPDPAVIIASAETAIRAYAASRYRIGYDVFPAGIFAAAKVGGVDDIELIEPSATVVCDETQIPHLSAVTVTATVL